MTNGDLNQFILHYLTKDKTHSAIMLTGSWGTGKSYYIQNVLVPFLKEGHGKECVTVSLYGLKSISEVSKNIYLELRAKALSAKGEAATAGKLIAKTIARGVVGRLGIDLSVDSSTMQELYESVDLSNKLVILEDVERSQIGILELLGYVNSLVAYQFIYERRTWYGMRFTNYGRRVATHVRICLEKEFLDSITEGTFYKGLYDLQSKEFVLGIGQSYDIFFGADDFRRRQNKCPIRGTIAYHDATLEENYIEAFEVDFEKYGSIFSVNTLADDLHLDMKRQTEELQKIGKSISELKKVHTDVQGKTVPEKEVCQGLLKELAARRCGEDGQAGRSRNGNQCAVGSETR